MIHKLLLMIDHADRSPSVKLKSKFKITHQTHIWIMKQIVKREFDFIPIQVYYKCSYDRTSSRSSNYYNILFQSLNTRRDSLNTNSSSIENGQERDRRRNPLVFSDETEQQNRSSGVYIDLNCDFKVILFFRVLRRLDNETKGRFPLETNKPNISISCP